MADQLVAFTLTAQMVLNVKVERGYDSSSSLRYHQTTVKSEFPSSASSSTTSRRRSNDSNERDTCKQHNEKY